ncbi:MAG TPA: hypothetical protein VMT12_03590 [Syntrophales bacterium]|nr:hypothetical protein [Syntrophales bacterium]
MINEQFELPTVSPFRLDLTAWVLRRRESNIIDHWDGHRYSRIVVIGNKPVKISVVQKNPSTDLTISISFQGKRESVAPIEEESRQLVRKMLGLDLNLRPFYSLGENDEVIGELVHRFYGVKPPRFPSIFEALVNAVACQQVSLAVGIILLGRLASKFGRVFKEDRSPLYAFPRPEDLTNASEEEIRQLGFSRQKARAIKELASGITSGKTNLVKLEDMADKDAVEYLSTLRGIGRWSAEYVLLRGLGRLDTFPGDDIGAQNNLKRLFGLKHKPDYDEIRKLMSRWHPYEGLVYFHLLLNKLHLDGKL